MLRRDVLKVLAGSTILPAFQLAAFEPGKPLYFTRQEFAALDELTEIIIPTDAHSPGAHEAGVATYIDKFVAEAFLAKDKETWRKGLAPYLPLNKQERIAMLKELAPNEDDPKTGAQRFFGQLKQTTAYVYYTSKVGIHQDVEYIGNVVQDQFAGYDAT